MPKGGGGRIQGVYHQKNRTKQTTAKGKQKGSNAVRRAVNRQIPALKRIANGSHTLRGAWEESGGDPLQWRVAHDKGETVYTEVCEIRQTGVVGLMFGQCDFIDGRVPDAIGDLRSSLQAISLEGCWSLSSLPDAFARLHLLENLDLSHCDRLAALPDGFGSLSSLRVLSMRNCESIETLPDSFTQLSRLDYLTLRGCSKLVALPSDIGALSALKNLDLSECRELKELPKSIGLLVSLQELSLNGCESLTALPDSICSLTSLRHLRVEKCPKLSLPAAIDTMTGLTLHYDLGGVVPPRTSSTSAFELAAASNRIRRRWASRYCFHCEKQVAETHPRFRCCGACRAAFYCSVDCQRKSWEADHRSSCSAHRRIRRRTCDVCGAFAGEDQPSFPVCGGCDARRYCGEACQIADWEAGHAQKCQA